MWVIWRLKRATTVRRRKQGLPPIPDPNDIPDPQEQTDYISVRFALFPFMSPADVGQVLSDEEQHRLIDQQEKFAKSQVRPCTFHIQLHVD